MHASAAIRNSLLVHLLTSSNLTVETEALEIHNLVNSAYITAKSRCRHKAKICLFYFLPHNYREPNKLFQKQ